jgi:hypothetical protein
MKTAKIASEVLCLTDSRRSATTAIARKIAKNESAVKTPETAATVCQVMPKSIWFLL